MWVDTNIFFKKMFKRTNDLIKKKVKIPNNVVWES